MKLFKVSNRFAGWTTKPYMVFTESEEQAVEIAAEKLKDEALLTNYSGDKGFYIKMGLVYNNIFDHIDKPTYHEYFDAICIADEIISGQAIDMSRF